MAKNTEYVEVPDFNQVPSKIDLLERIAGCFALHNKWANEQLDVAHEHMIHSQGVIIKNHNDKLLRLGDKNGDILVELGFGIIYYSKNNVIYKNGKPIYLGKTQEDVLIEVMLDNTGVDNTAEFIINMLNENGLDLKEKLKNTKKDNVVQMLLDIWSNAEKGELSFLFESGNMVKKTKPELLFRCNFTSSFK